MSKSRIVAPAQGSRPAFRVDENDTVNLTLVKPQRRRRQKKQNKGKQEFSTQMVSAPAATSVQVRSQRPQVKQTKGGGVRVRGRDLVLATVAGSVAFTVQSFIRINPGLAATFPWLYPIALQYEQYAVRRLRFCWIPIAPTSTQGDVIMSPNYDASDPQPTTEQQASNNYGAVSSPCWAPFCVDYDPTAMMGLGPRRFVRSCMVSGDIKTFDVGTLALCSVNETGTTAVGKLYVEYDIEFFIPQNDPSPSTGPQNTSYYTRNVGQVFTNGVAASLQFNNVVYDPLNFGTPVAGLFTPAAGCYRIHMTVSCADTASESFSGNVLFLKNGNNLDGNIQCTFAYPSAIGANAENNMSLFAVIPFSGTDTFQVWVTLNGASGNLTVAGSNAFLMVELA